MADSSSRRLDLFVGGKYRLGMKIGSGSWYVVNILYSEGIRDPLSQVTTTLTSSLNSSSATCFPRPIMMSTKKSLLVVEMAMERSLPTWRQHGKIRRTISFVDRFLYSRRRVRPPVDNNKRNWPTADQHRLLRYHFEGQIEVDEDVRCRVVSDPRLRQVPVHGPMSGRLRGSPF
jgi:hypothetical protein